VSRENVDIVKKLHEALVAADWERATDLVVPEVEFHGTVGGLEEGRVARGIDQYRHVDGEDLEAWDERRLEAEDFVDAGDCVVILQREYRRGKGSGVEVEAEIAILADVRDGRVARIQGYMDRGAAIEAATRKASRAQPGV
jgi:ketosteroid isomerase-like protein